MKKSLWNYLMIGVCFAVIVVCFIPFFRNGCCVPGYDENGVQHIACSYSWDSILSRFASSGAVAILIFVLYLLMAGCGMVFAILSDLLKGDKKLILISVVLTSLTIVCFIPVVFFATMSYQTC